MYQQVELQDHSSYCKILSVLVIVEWEPELTIYGNQIGLHPNCHQRSFMQELMQMHRDPQSRTGKSSKSPVEESVERLYEPGKSRL